MDVPFKFTHSLTMMNWEYNVHEIKRNRNLHSGSILEVSLNLPEKSHECKTREINFWDITESFKGNTKEAIMNEIAKS